jgi:catechol-2,3-dioxygenase
MTHASSLVAALRSVSLSVPDLALAEDFFVRIWRLAVVARTPDAVYFRGAGEDHHLRARPRSCTSPFGHAARRP